MPEVYIPKDLTQVQNKVMFGLTRRQLVCFSLAAVVSVPIYLLTRKPLGGDAAMVLLIVSALPFFFTALYRKNGQPVERCLKNYVRVRFLTPQNRPYQTNSRLAALERQAQINEEVEHIALYEQKKQPAFAKKHRLEQRPDRPTGHAADKRAAQRVRKNGKAGKTRR